MVQTIQASNIKELGELVDRFGLEQTSELDFFPEWQQDLPALSEFEQQALQDMQQDYQHLSLYANLEPIVKMVVVGPLLKMAGFYRPPFRVKAEKRVELTAEDEGTIVRGQLIWCPGSARASWDCGSAASFRRQSLREHSNAEHWNERGTSSVPTF